MTRASESGHWYDPKTGQPAYDQPNKSKPGEMRKTTIADARKLGLVPGVTSIIKVLDKPALNVWRQEQTIKACYENPRLVITSATEHHGIEPWNDYKSRIIPIAEQVATKAAEKGTEIHAILEDYFLTGALPEDEGGKATIARVAELLEIHCGKQTWLAEKCFVGKDYGTKIDLLSDEWLLDFKSKDGDQEAIDKEKLYDEHFMQLAAGERLVAGTAKERSQARIHKCAIILASRDHPGAARIGVMAPEEHMRGASMFDLCLRLWRLKNRWTNGST